MKWLFSALENLVWLAQLGLSMMMPLLLCLGACWWLNIKLGVGGWVYIPGFLLGLGGGAVSFKNFSKLLMHRADQDNQHRPISFNKH